MRLLDWRSPPIKKISVKNLYEDAMKDPLLSKYLPTKEQLSNKLPQKDFFFGVLSTLRNKFMQDIISDSSRKRVKIEDDDPKKSGILITKAWM